MLPLHLLDEDAVEALLAGRPVTPGLAPLAGAIGQIRAAARQPVRPSDELARRMASGDFSGIEPAPLTPVPSGHRLRSWLAGVSPRARVVTGAVVVFTGLTAATAAGALPGGAQARMESFIESVTPISFQRDEPDVDRDDVRDAPSHVDGATAEPDDSGRPDDPGSPVTPPGKPETPPGKPETPGNPDKPETPPGKPETPPGKPETPGVPETPPIRPETPPGQPEEPGNSEDAPGQAETPPGQRETPPGRPEAPGQESGNGAGNAGNGNSGDRPHGPDR
ncbi:hypothetical protein [Jiangella rhizosphaerae]|uniref:hypothetical protein n=1 Tax=Jiangella rhizosphaerae TaxID=2293569 RepID=UPI001313EE3C|nr:hypothetical protein [Jiangella rhizosphaerae]